MNARVHIVPTGTYTKTVNVWGFDLDAEYGYDAGEPAINDAEYGHPGTPPNATLYGCRIGGVQVVEMLTASQIETIEDAILEGAQQ